MNRELGDGKMLSEEAAANLAAWKRVDSVLGVGATAPSGEAPSEVLEALTERQTARKARDFQRADAIREKLLALGWIIEDTPNGSRVKRA